MSEATTLLSVRDYQAHARQLLPRQVYDYYAGGAEEERTLRANSAAFGSYWFRPRVLRDVSTINTRLELLGCPLELPVLLAPTAFQMLAHPDGELASARAARAAGTIYIASTLATCSVEHICAAAGGGHIWFQLYVFRSRELTTELIARAEAAGVRALCLTVTVPVQGRRERDARNKFALPDGMEMANFPGQRQAHFPDTAESGLDAFIAREFDATLSWDTLAWLAEFTRLPILLKGIMTAEDARLAVEHGAAAVIISNHGGRQLDGAPATLDVLPEIVDAVRGAIPVLIDGGIRRGSDVAKALALGATATLIGRPYLWGLAVNGQQGVEHVLSLLHDELRRVLALCGRTSVRELSPDLLRRSDWPGTMMTATD